MNRLQHCKVALTCVCLLTLPAACAANISKADYTAGKARISATYKADRSSCDSQSANAKDVCVQEAKAVEAKAPADAKMGKEIGDARQDAAAEKLDADYKVAILAFEQHAKQPQSGRSAAA
jgi:hypothetical protein